MAAVDNSIPKVEIDIASLHPLHPEVIAKQATINIGTIGHVAHGKSTVVKAISGVQVSLYSSFLLSKSILTLFETTF